MKKILIYSPYVPKHFGGGEKYLFDVAIIMTQLGHQVYIGMSNSNINININNIKQKYENFLGYSLKKISFIQTPLGTNKNFINKLLWTKQFDVIYYITNGSLFFSLAKKNILHIQIPITNFRHNLVNKLKLINWNQVTTISTYTKKIIEKYWRKKVDYVHYPMISVNSTVDFKKKQNIILSVGRFFDWQHSKRQDVLVEIFKKMIEQYPDVMNNWQLVLIGFVESEKYLTKVKKLAKGLPVKIITDASRNDLLDWYKKSEIYWHAAGFKVKEQINPANVEHFGITTVEAMSFGCLPLVVGKGGQLEVIGNEKKFENLFWQTREDCLHKTQFYIKEKKQRRELQKLLVKRAEIFGKRNFVKITKKLLQ